MPSLHFGMSDNVIFEGNVDVDLSDYVKMSMIVLKNELMKHGDLYNGFLASIESALEEKIDSAELWHSDIFIDSEEWAKAVMSRIIGED